MNNLKVRINGKTVKRNSKSTKDKLSGSTSISARQRRIDEFNKSKGKKKKKKNQKKEGKGKIKKYILRIFGLIVLAGIIGGGYFGYTRWDRLQKFNVSIIANTPDAEICDNIFDTKCWREAFSPKLEQENGITGVLIVGLDTREDGGVNQGLMNTDSIIVALYDHSTKKTTLVSFPRDLYIPYNINGGGPYYSKINALYATGEQRDDIDDGFELLEETVEDILDKQIQYRVIIKLKGVEEAVDAVDGVEIDVPTYVKAQYPNDYPGQDGKPSSRWLYYEFQPGKQIMDGEHALVWSRFRMVIKGDMNMASDFSRAERQQQVIDALKTKILEDEEQSKIKKAEKYWDIFQTINKYVEADIGLEEIFASFSLVDEADINPINVVLDPNFGGLNRIIYHPPTAETGGYMIKFKDPSFATAQAYLEKIWDNPKLYDENASILIENHLGRAYIQTDKVPEFRDEVYAGTLPITSSNITLTTNGSTGANGVIIVDLTGGEMSGTTKYLAEYFGATQIIEDPETHGYSQSNYEEDIKVIISPDPEPEPADTV